MNSSEVLNDPAGDVSVVSAEELQNRKGCLGWLFFWKKEKDGINDIPVTDKKMTSEKQKEQIDTLGLIVDIKEKLNLKRIYKKFVQDVANVEAEYSKNKIVCDGFKLTTHSNSSFPLIDLEKLKELQRQTYKDRFEAVYNEWIDAEERTYERIKNMMEEKSKSYADKFAFIDWNDPFPFVIELSVKDNFPQICNKLQSLASPFVNYNLTSTVKEDKIIRKLYSDIPTILDDFKEMKGSLNEGNEIGVYCSSHMESKICMMQFLPMDDDVLANLVDLQESSASNVDDVSDISQTASNDSTGAAMQEEEMDGRRESINNDIEFWGDH